AVPFDLRILGDDAIGEVLSRGTDDGERRAQLVRDGGDELHLLPRETLLPLRYRENQDDTGGKQSEHAEADRQIATARLRNDRVERSASMTDSHLPRAFISTAHQHTPSRRTVRAAHDRDRE